MLTRHHTMVTSQSSTRGFTLIELLVVMAIIAILAAVLFPVFAQAREKARLISCMSNQRQIAMAILMWTQEHNEAFPQNVDVWQSLAVPQQVRICLTNGRGKEAYIYNSKIGGKSLAEFTAPSMKLMTADGFHAATASTLTQIAYSWRDIAPRHQGKYIASFVDGHVELRTLAAPVIAYLAHPDGNEDICVVREDGSGYRQLTKHAAYDGIPAVSPDGRQVVFTSKRDGNSELYRVNIDGTGLTRLTDNSADDYCGRFNPDGTLIVFTSERTGTPNDIYVLNLQTQALTRLTNGTGTCGAPLFTPDGNRILFSYNNQLADMSSTGGAMRIMPTSGIPCSNPAISQDGSIIAFTSTDDILYTMKTDGTGLAQFSKGFMTVFGPEDNRLLFDTWRAEDGAYRIYQAAPTDYLQQHRLDLPNGECLNPAWGGSVL